MQQSNTVERFVGVDFHKQTFTVTRLLQDGSRCGKTQTFKSTRESILDFRASCTARDHVVVEATYHWALFADCFEDFEGELCLAHPAKNRLIAESSNKCDTVDSKVLADLRRTNFLAQAWIAPKEVREARELLRHRCSLVRVQTMLKNRVRVLLAKAGKSIEARDIFGAGALEELRALNLGATREQIVRGYIDVAEQLIETIKGCEKEIRARVALDENAQRVDRIKGFGALAALTVVMEIGDISRFKSVGKLVSYAGLAPINRESAGKLRHGHISKQGSPWLRWILIEATTHAIAAYPELAALYQRVCSHNGNRANIGRVAVARQLLSSIYCMLKRKVEFDPRRIGGRKAEGGRKECEGKAK